MSQFKLHQYSGMAYDAEQTIAFSNNQSVSESDIDKEMQSHLGVSAVQVSNLNQNEFDYFVSKYADAYESIYFFQNTKVIDLSALSKLKNVKYLLFYNVRAASLWDMRQNDSLKGIMISDSKKMLYDLEQLQYAPNIEELLLFSSMFSKYPVKTIAPLKACLKLKRLFIVFNTEDKSFIPEEFCFLDVLKYQCDRKKNFTY